MSENCEGILDRRMIIYKSYLGMTGVYEGYQAMTNHVEESRPHGLGCTIEEVTRSVQILKAKSGTMAWRRICNYWDGTRDEFSFRLS